MDSMAHSVGADLRLAHDLADLAVGIAQRYAAAGRPDARIKDDGSPVTDADEEIERALRSRIREQNPGDGFLGEETGGESPGEGRDETRDASAAGAAAQRRWIIDGIDGTASFLAGEPEWSTLIALQERGEVTLGMVAAPALGRRWWAGRGHGAWTAPHPLRPGAAAQRLSIAGGGSLRQAAIGIWPPPPRLSAAQRTIAANLAAHAASTRPAIDWSGSGSAAAGPALRPAKPSAGSGTCHGSLLVATGRLDAFVLMGAGAWDVAALVAIVREAGGVFSDLAGRDRLETGTAVFARPGVHRELLDAAMAAKFTEDSGR